MDDKARYSYDAFNRTVKVETFDGNVQVNRYDAEGLRHEMEENGRLVRFIFHKGEAVAEQEENSNVIRLLRGSELIARSSDSESAWTYYHYASDEMGSTTHIVDESGNVQNRYAYDVWGNLTVQEEAIPNRFKYTGQQFDPVTQQYYLRARFYNPVIGRFTQEDTYRGDGLNLYAYCANNPVYYVDPSGHTATCLKEAYLKEAERLKNEYVNDSMSAEEKAAVIEQARKDAYQAAKQVYQANYAVNNPTPNLPQVSDRTMTRQQWNDAYRDSRMGTQTVNGVKIYSDDTLIKTTQTIHFAQYSNKWWGKVNPISVTQAVDGPVVVTKNNSVIGGISRSVAKEFFGVDVVIPSGRGTQYNNNLYGSVQNRDRFTTRHPKHAEARGIQGLINSGIDPTGARQATTRPACLSCAHLQVDWNIDNLTF